VVGEILIVTSKSVFNNFGVGAKSLNDDFGGIKMTTSDTTNDLVNKLKSALLGGEIWQRKASISLNNTNGSELRQIEAFGDGLSANNDIDGAIFYFGIECIEGIVFGVVGIKASDFSSFKKLF